MLLWSWALKCRLITPFVVIAALALPELLVAQAAPQRDAPCLMFGLTPEYIAQLRVWLDRDPDDSEVREVLAIALELCPHDLDGAISQLEELIRRKPESVFSYVRLARLLSRKKPLAEAIDYFDARLRSNPQSAGVHAALGELLGQRGDLDGKIRHLRESVRLGPEVNVQLELAGALAAAGDKAGSIAQDKLAMTLMDQFDDKKAETAIELLRRLNNACQSYKLRYGRYPPDLKSLGLPSAGGPPSVSAAALIDPILARGDVRSNHRFVYGLNGAGYSINASSERSQRRFYTDQTQVIRQDLHGDATGLSPPISQ
jgi:tetratricopeptide (TPR) repeat protein